MDKKAIEPISSRCLECNKEFDADKIKKHLSDSNHKDYELIISEHCNNPKDKLKFHSMEKALNKYLSMKIHNLIKEGKYDEIIIKGKYDRWASTSNNEKKDKRFNWKGPTARVNGNKLHILCFPGQDYILHYGLIIFYYFYINNLKIPKITVQMSNEEICQDSLDKTNINQMPQQDVVIMGYIDKLIQDFPDWEGDGDFKWKRFYISNHRVALLGCKFSYWGDIGGRIVKTLANQGTKLVIYIGKLGGLKEEYLPNVHLATGEESKLDSELIKWKNPFHNEGSEIIKEGKHITIPSILMETKQWLKNLNNEYSFVDPEIGHMAKASLEKDIGFGYLHIISDNLKKEYKENLSNERRKSVLEKRELIIKEIRGALNNVFKDGRN